MISTVVEMTNQNSSKQRILREIFLLELGIKQEKFQPYGLHLPTPSLQN